MEDVHPDTLRALNEVFGYKTLTDTQVAAIPPSLAGHDVFVRAPTGSGKTIAFLVPVIQALVGSDGKGVGALVLSPSRELAQQTREQAKRLLTFHEGLEACLVMGGTDAQKERTAVMSGSCQLLVATPGRLLDHINNGLGEKLSSVRVLVLDEADRLLDMGFKPVIEEIASKLPSSTKRQTLLFTATVPDGVKDVAGKFMRKTFKFVDVATKQSVRGGANIDQRVVVVPPQRTLSALQRVLTKERKSPDHKVIVFVTTARMVTFVAAYLRAEGHADTMELYGDMSQSQRTRVTQKFHNDRGCVLVASDVVARGVDFPDVTCVVQLGVASSDEQYVHRIGRTGRAGKKGRAVAILGEDEVAAIPASAKELKSFRTAGSGASAGAKASAKSTAAAKFASLKTPGRGATSLNNLASRAFRASLGFYGSQAKRLGWKGAQLVDNVWARFAPMMESPPEIKAELWKKLGCGAVCAKRWAAISET